jgi:hypothetical protein
MIVQELRETVHQFYRSQGIAVEHFRCPKSQECDAAADHLLSGRGSEAHIGSLYGSPIKLVIVSLDRGEGAEDVWSRTASIESLSLDDGDLNPHMRGTRQTLNAIFGDYILEVWKRFAMINAAKCCLGRGMRMAPDPLYWACPDFGISELGLLQPDVVVTQGKNARAMLNPKKRPLSEKARAAVHEFSAQCSAPEVRRSIDAMVESHLHEAGFGQQNCLWLDTPHPSDQGGRWHSFKRVILPVLGRIIRVLHVAQFPPDSEN